MSEGILLFASGQKHTVEAEKAQAQMTALWPDVETYIAQGPEEPTHLVMGHRIQALGKSPFTKTLYLDSDCWLAEPVPELFDVLENFDVALAHAPWRMRYPVDVPECFPEFNGGVFAFKRCYGVERLFKDWGELFLEHSGGTDPGAGTGYFPSQPSLREALYHSSVSIATLPPEYNWRGNGYVQGAVKIVHMHADCEAEEWAINEHAGKPRVKMGEIRVWF